MTINDPERYCAGLWDWAILDGCFGETKIKPTDVDGFVERKGKFLWLETKAPGAEVPYGQQLTFNALIKTGIFTVFIIWGTTNAPQEIQIMTYLGKCRKEMCSLEKLRDLTSRWYRWVDKP
jgi:hypothetical protein